MAIRCEMGLSRSVAAERSALRYGSHTAPDNRVASFCSIQLVSVCSSCFHGANLGGRPQFLAVTEQQRVEAGDAV